MELSATTLAELIKSLRSNAPVGQEKRKQPRVGLRLRSRILLTSDPTNPVVVWVRDVSAGGVNIACGQQFHAGDEFKMVLDEHGEQLLSCTVMHCRKLAAGMYGTGAKFNDYPPAEEAERPDPQASERSGGVRELFRPEPRRDARQ